MTTTTWWPSPYGVQDQIGMRNEITPAKTAVAARLVHSGRAYDLASVLDEQVPVFPGRTFRQSLVTSAHHLNRRRPDAGTSGWDENNINGIIDLVSSTSQMGTHLDGLNHLQIGDRFYNGHTLVELAEEWGTNRLGMETVPQNSGDIVVVSAGAVNSAVLLLKSANDKHPNGLANRSGVVGRHYMAHHNTAFPACPMRRSSNGALRRRPAEFSARCQLQGA